MPTQVSDQAEIAVLQTKVESMDRTLTKLSDNHIPHIYQEMQDLNEKVDSVKEDLMNEISDVKVKIAMYVGTLTGIGIAANLLISKFFLK